MKNIFYFPIYVYAYSYEKNNKNKDIYFEIRFLDSFKFMQCSLDSLVKNLKPEQLENLNTFEDSHKVKLLQKKVVYPYDYMDSFSKFKETKLPSKETFESFK